LRLNCKFLFWFSFEIDGRLFPLAPGVSSPDWRRSGFAENPPPFASAGADVQNIVKN
jgi:hypothetical protein